MTGKDLRDALRQMLAALEQERQALAALDLDGIVGAASDKHCLCGALERSAPSAIDEECRGMLDAARRLNEINRQVRNLVAANVATRLNAIVGSPHQLYRGGRTGLRRKLA